MSEVSLVEIGAGGAIAIIIIREVLGFIIKQKKNGNEVVVTRAEFEKHKDSVQYKDTCGEIVKRIENGFEDIKGEFKEVKQLIRNGGK